MFNPATFPTLQQNPILQGFNAAQGMQRNNLQNQNLAIQNQQAPQMLALRQMLAHIAQQNANTGSQNIGLQFTKEKDTKQNAINRAQQNPGIQALIANDPQAAQGYLQQTKDFFTNPYAPYGQQGARMQSAQPQVPMRQPMPMQTQGVPMQSAQPQSASQQQMPMQQQGVPQQQGMPAPQGSISPETLAAAKDATQSNLIRKNTPDNIVQQRYFNKSIKPLLQKIQSELPDASKYFGVIGQANAGADKIGLRFGKNAPKEYQSYLNLTQDYQNLANEARRALGDHATDKQQQLIEKFVTPDFGASTQQSVLNNLKNLQNLYGIIDQTAQQSPAQVSQQGSPSPSPSQTQAQPSAAGGGTTLMTGTDGKRYHVKNDQVADAISSHGWRVAGG